MKASLTKPAKTPESTFSQGVIRKRVSKAEAEAAVPKPEKRENVFSKSRDTREDRGTRQMKTTQNTQSLSRGR